MEQQKFGSMFSLTLTSYSLCRDIVVESNLFGLYHPSRLSRAMCGKVLFFFAFLRSVIVSIYHNTLPFPTPFFLKARHRLLHMTGTHFQFH